MSEEVAQGLEILKVIVGPAAGISLVVMLVVRLLGGEKLTPLAASLAVVAGLYAGNHFRALMAELVRDQHPTLETLRSMLAQVLERVREPGSMPQLHYWLPWLAILAAMVELLVGWSFVPSSFGWIARGLVAFFAARALTPQDMRDSFPEAPWLLGGAMLLIWAVTTELARQWKDGVVGLVLIVCFIAAILVMKQQASSLSLMDMTVLCMSAIVGPALVVWKWPGDIGPAVAAAAIVLPAALLRAYQSNAESNAVLYPFRNFIMIALAPLSMTPMLLPRMLGLVGPKRWLPAVLLPLIPVALAVYWVLKETPLTFTKGG